MTSLEPAIKYHVNKWKAANVPEDLINIRARQIAVSALRKYKPTQGYGGKVASPGSWVQNQMNQLQRFVVTNQNAGRIQESRAGKNKRVFDEAYQLLRNQLGRDPTIKELSEQMTLSMGKPVTHKQARMYVREQRRDNNVSDENFTYTPTDTRMLIKLLPEELTPLENQVFERVFGLNGCRKMKPGEIARDLRIDNSRVSRLKAKITQKAQEYL
jgi:DNA-directed RNA polymerase specialized sigma subunit